MEPWITIATFQFHAEIAILKHQLERIGIPFLFENEHLIASDPFASLAYGGIRLKIHPNDAEQVEALLNDLFPNDFNLKII